MYNRRLTTEGDSLKIETLTFGEILIANREKIAKIFDAKNGYFNLKGVKILLTEEEIVQVQRFLENVETA